MTKKKADTGGVDALLAHAKFVAGEWSRSVEEDKNSWGAMRRRQSLQDILESLKHTGLILDYGVNNLIAADGTKYVRSNDIWKKASVVEAISPAVNKFNVRLKARTERLNVLIDSVGDAYDVDSIDSYWDYDNGTVALNAAGGDTLAEFIVRELHDCCKGYDSDLEMHIEALRCMRSAREQLDDVVVGLEKLLVDTAQSEEFSDE